MKWFVAGTLFGAGAVAIAVGAWLAGGLIEINDEEEARLYDDYVMHAVSS